VSGDVNDVILLAFGGIERHTSMGLFPLNIYHWVPGYPTNYSIGYLDNKLPGCGSPNHILPCPFINISPPCPSGMVLYR